MFRLLDKNGELIDITIPNQLVTITTDEIQRLLQDAATNKWQPIETAPNDGTRVLLGRFTGDKTAMHEGKMSVDWYRREDEAGFIGFGHFNNHYWPATHWQPLPAEPNKTV